MDAITYAREAARTMIDDDAVTALTARQRRIIWNVLGLADAVGELMVLHDHKNLLALVEMTLALAGAVKTQIFHAQGLDAARLAGDLRLALWLVGVYAHDVLPHQRKHQAALTNELGEYCWYAAALATCLDLDFAALGDPVYAADLAPIWEANIARRRAHFPGGGDTAGETGCVTATR